MHNFWYHSPVRFYPSLEDLADMTNPQNTQYFGENSVYPLEVNDFHRFIIPNFQNEVSSSDLSIWCVNNNEEYRIVSVCEIFEGLLKYVTFKSRKNISGRLEIRNDSGETLFYSNCVEFVDSTDHAGRKFIRIATKHTYNRHLFDYQSPYNWIITSVPAYCLGMAGIEADISTSRIGKSNSLKIRESSIDEVVQYEFASKGDSNLLNFLQVHVTNNHFYIDGTQRTSINKMDRDEFSMYGKLSFTNVKDQYGNNIPLDYSTVLNNIIVTVLGNNSGTIIYADNNNNLIGL